MFYNVSRSTMPTTIFTAGEYNPEKERRKRLRIMAVICIVIILGALAYSFRNWPYEHRASQFFTLLQAHHYKQAYALWLNDPDWERHPAQYKNYPFDDFYRDWGPGGEWGAIRSHDIVGSAAKGSGVIVVVRINGRVEPARLWIEKKDKTFTFSPY
jgi:hypothetical protein